MARRSPWFRMRWYGRMRVAMDADLTDSPHRRAAAVPLYTPWGSVRWVPLETIQRDMQAAQIHPDVMRWLTRREALTVKEGL